MFAESLEKARTAALGWIASADTKATAMLTITGALLALLGAVLATADGAQSLGAIERIAFVGFCIAAIASIGTSTVVLRPRTDRLGILKEKGWHAKGPSPTYFRDLAKLSADEFKKLHSEQNTESLALDTAEQTHVLSVIASDKMCWLRVSVWAFAAALVLLGVFVVAAAFDYTGMSTVPADAGAAVY